MLNATHTILSNKENKTDAFCFYQIIPAQNTSKRLAFREIKDRGDGLNVFVNVKKADFLNFYLWGGQNRESANRVVIDGNAGGMINVDYNNIGTEGLFMVVFPTQKDKNTTLEFEYWVDRFEDSMLDRIWTKNYRDAFGIWSLIIFIVIVVCVICCCICGCFVIWKYFCRKHQIRGYQLEDGITSTT